MLAVAPGDAYFGAILTLAVFGAVSVVAGVSSALAVWITEMRLEKRVKSVVDKALDPIMTYMLNEKLTSSQQAMSSDEVKALSRIFRRIE